MNRKIPSIPLSILILSLALSACAGFLPLDETPAPGDYGPAYSPQEHQTRTLEALWTDLQDNYIYRQSAGVNWDGLLETYRARVAGGLSDEEFNALLHKLETDLPSGSLVYQSRAERIQADATDTSTFEGIGAFIGFDAKPVPHIVLLSVMEGSPAEAAGLKAHDSILGIDGDPIQLEEGLDAVKRVRGPAGSSVTLDVRTPGKAERSIELQRAKLAGTGTLETRLIPGTNYGYLLFPPIGYDTMMDDVMKGLQAFTTNRKLEGLILDLRIAGSSRGWPLEELFGLFHKGDIGEFYNNAGRNQKVTVVGKDVSNSQSVPLIVIVGQNTSGFPEILAASLQAEGRATIVGANTPGDVETTSTFYLPNGSRAFIQSASFRLPNGEDIGNSGVKPDVLHEAGWDEVVPQADPVLESAIQALGEQK